MTKIKIQHVQQPTSKTCVHACLSMVTGVPVEDLVARFKDRGLTTMDDYVVLTELGILPVPIDKIMETLFPYYGVYFVSVPSANHHRKTHAMVLELTRDDDAFVLYDPNEGREGQEVYARDCFNTGNGLFSYGDIKHLQVMEGHAGNDKRRHL